MRLYEILTEGVAGPKNCWPGYRKTGTQPGTGKNKGKRVNDCEKIKEDEVDESGLQYYTGVKKHGKEYMTKAAQPARNGASQKELGALKDKYSKAYKEDADINEAWSQKYKKSINCSHPKGFSQKAHCAGKKKNESIEMEMTCPDCGWSEASILEAKKGLYYYVNKRKKAGTSRPASSPKAPTAQAWKDAAKTAKKEGVAEGSSDDFYAMALQKYPQLKQVDREIVINALNNAYEDYLMHYGYEGIGPDEESSMIDHAVKGLKKGVAEAGSPAQQAAIAINMKKQHKKPKNESLELAEEFDMIENIIEQIADQHAIDADLVWEDLSTLTDDELYVFAVTSEMVNEDWQKANKRDKTDGMSKKAVNAYRRENPGSKLKTAVTTKPSKLKKGSKASKRRKSYCSRSRGQMKMHSISCSKTPDKAICKARRRWNC